MLIRGQQYEVAPESELEDYFTDPHWVMEQKADGVRLMVHVSAGAITLTGSKGLITFAAATQWFDELLEKLGAVPFPDCVIDGELLIETGEFLAFDLPYLQGHVRLNTPWYVRHAALVTLCEWAGIRVIDPAEDEVTKRALWMAVSVAGCEGVVVKHIDAPYRPGERTSAVRKVKLTHTIDCVILERNVGGATNARLGLHRDGEVVPIGNVSMIGKEGDVGQVVEVAFQCIRNLDDPSLTSPRVMRLREDKAPEDCLFDQVVGLKNTKAVLS